MVLLPGTNGVYGYHRRHLFGIQVALTVLVYTGPEKILRASIAEMIYLDHALRLSSNSMLWEGDVMDSSHYSFVNLQISPS